MAAAGGARLEVVTQDEAEQQVDDQVESYRRDNARPTLINPDAVSRATEAMENYQWPRQDPTRDTVTLTGEQFELIKQVLRAATDYVDRDVSYDVLVKAVEALDWGGSGEPHDAWADHDDAAPLGITDADVNPYRQGLSDPTTSSESSTLNSSVVTPEDERESSTEDSLPTLRPAPERASRASRATEAAISNFALTWGDDPAALQMSAGTRRHLTTWADQSSRWTGPPGNRIGPLTQLNGIPILIAPMPSFEVRALTGAEVTALPQLETRTVLDGVYDGPTIERIMND